MSAARGVWLAAGLAVVAAVALLTARIVGATGGLFFTLDDPYIHLSVAENLLAHGVYGINPTQASSPSSSILWPFVLVPLEALGAGPWGVWALNLVLAILAVGAASRAVATVTPGWHGLPVVPAFCVATNLVGLVFTGMEHVAQVAAAAGAAYGGSLVARADPPPRWLWLLLVLGPLIRYENLAITVPMLAWLWSLGHRRAVLACALTVGGSLAGFSAFLLAQGMWALPSSVVAKSLHVETNGIWAPLANALFNLLEWGGGMVFAMAALLMALHRWRREDAPGLSQLALVGVAVASLHLLFGRNGWFHRYEVYALAFTTLVAVCAARPVRPARFAAVATTILLAVGWPYALGLLRIVPAAQNVHAQQYQLHRLVSSSPRAVGVNDLGWVSYRNDGYVYDFFGLGNYDAIVHRRAGDDPSWMVQAADEAGLELVMLSPHWFDLDVPPAWHELGALCLAMRQVTAADVEVRFFSPKTPSVALLTDLRQWAATLPKTARFVPGRCPRDAGLHGAPTTDI